jgi:hypothetical protein
MKTKKILSDEREAKEIVRQAHNLVEHYPIPLLSGIVPHG